MRGLKRNQKKFQYYPHTGLTSDLNSDGDHTGQREPVYGSPVTYSGTFSTASGQTSPTFYGRDLRYTHVLVMTNMKADIKETGYILWKGDKYEIKAVADSLNVKNIALRRMSPDEKVIIEETPAGETEGNQVPEETPMEPDDEEDDGE